jgi:hypothetical protein
MIRDNHRFFRPLFSGYFFESWKSIAQDPKRKKIKIGAPQD